MMYLIATEENAHGYESYLFFDSITDSFFSGNRTVLIRLVRKHEMEPKSLTVDENNIWFNQTYHKKIAGVTGASHVLVCRLTNGKFKLAGYNKKIVCLNDRGFKHCVTNNKIANCQVQDGKCKLRGHFRVTGDLEFEQEIATKYEKFIAKSAMMGRKLSFEYDIENKIVKLKNYTGTDKNVIVPKFVTAIMEKAFIKCEIETVTLEQGLRHIGSYAFSGCKLKEIIIPKSVAFIGAGAFVKNKDMLTKMGSFVDGRIILLNKETTVIDYYDNSAYLGLV